MLALLALSIASPSLPYFAAPSGREIAQIRPGGQTILPNGRFLTPPGKRLYTGANLWRIILSPDGTSLFAMHDGGITRYRAWDAVKPDRKMLARKEIAPGVAFLADKRTLAISLGDDGKIELIDSVTLESKGEIDVNASKKDSYLNDLALSPDGSKLYAVDVANQELVTIDVQARSVINRVKAGREPYALAIDPKSGRVYVANIGVFDYSLITPPREGEGFAKGLTHPAFGFPSKEAEKGVDFEGRWVPGLGSHLAPESQSLWSYRLGEDGLPRFEKGVKCGLLIQSQSQNGRIVGASQPNALLVHHGLVYVSNANNDTIQAFDAKSLALKRTIKLVPQPALAMVRGVIPSHLSASGDGERVYVCASGMNAVAAIEARTGRILGYTPSGWWPTWTIERGGKLFVATQKGLGRGPRGPQHARKPGDERFGFGDMPGMVHVLDKPSGTELVKGERTMLANNGLVPKPRPKSPSVFPTRPGKKSPKIDYVVFITKENHTFDGIFGGLKGARGFADYAEFGMQGWISEKGRDRRMPIMPNHIKLAEQFAISENFYMEPQASGDGHRWLVGVYPSFWTNRVFYSGWDFRRTMDARGRLVSFGSNGSQIPEDYLENGSLWEHLQRGGIPFRNYGEGFEFPASDEGTDTTKTGVFEPANWPMPKVLFDNTCFEFPVYNTNIPDIARAQWFIDDIEKNFRAKGKPLPRFINIAICNDHGDTPRPQFGYPYVSSYMADNDLALGRIVEYLSKQPEWKRMAIFVTQDDPGGDNDHIDRHRSFVLAISPYVKRGHISKDHTSIMSILRSIYLLFGLGPNTMFDAVSTPLYDMFTDKPDFTPYRAAPSTLEVFDPAKTVDPADPKFEKRKRLPKPALDDPDFIEWLRKRSGNDAGGQP